MAPKRLILLELNEVNFDLIKGYIESSPDDFPSFAELFRMHNICTESEAEYSSLEPWIQWVSIHTGLKFSEHKIFRLGDITDKPVTQIFELVESGGFKVGCISPMNTDNRLKSPLYFLPDPWTKTKSDSTWWGVKISQAISQSVNSNATGYIAPINLFYLLLCFIRFFNVNNLFKYIAIGFGSLRMPWKKAFFLDMLLHDIHLKFLSKRNPDFSTIFFNSAAHIQHHYLLNSHHMKECKSENNLIKNPDWYIPSEIDPVREVYRLYDGIVGDYIRMKDAELLVATGLSQVKYDVIKYYYRLKNHENFLSMLGLDFKKVYPRMTRDFLIEFSAKRDVEIAFSMLKSLRLNDTNDCLFGEIDNRGLSLFVTLTYPNEITPTSYIRVANSKLNIYPLIAFVALKNGKHQGKGYAFFSEGLVKYAPESGSHVCRIFDVITGHFSLNQNLTISH